MADKQKLPKHIIACVDLDSNVLKQSIVLLNTKNKTHIFVDDRFDSDQLMMAVSRLESGSCFNEDGPYSHHIGKQIVF